MEIAKFTEEFDIITSEIVNTNYGSIVAEFKLVILIQEFLLNNKFLEYIVMNKIEIELNKESENEARIQALGEIYMNFLGNHTCVSMKDDYGQEYINNLFRHIKNFKNNDSLFKKCNS